jgi:hypothetical protein
MKKVLCSCLLLAFICVFSSALAAGPARVDVLYMNHGPLMGTLDKMKSVFSAYGDKISVFWYDFESKKGEDFKAQKGISQHVPLVIWIDGHKTVQLGQEQVKFVGFPTGAGPSFFQGKWTIDDLKTALDQATADK